MVGFVPFDSVRSRVVDVLKGSSEELHGLGEVYLVRNLYGKLRIAVSEAVREDEDRRNAVRGLAVRLQEKLGAYAYPEETAVLFVDSERLNALREDASKIASNVYWVDRLMTGSDWWTVKPSPSNDGPRRYTLFSVKGGVGRSTTAAVLAWHLARSGERVLVVDLDLESPGLSSAMLDARTQPEFGVTDWFVEDLVGQGERVIGRMSAHPSWSPELEGDVRVVPAHGSEPGEYLAKLGRVHVGAGTTWAKRLGGLLSRLEDTHKPTVALLESRSGLHDIAAATVTDLNARVLLFAADSESTWTDYGILFRHWRDHDLATSIRERLFIVSALTPELDTELYLQRFRQQAWSLFRDHLYDEIAPAATGDEFSFALDDDEAPHHPIPIHWNRGLAAGASLRLLDRAAVYQAYTAFLKWFDGEVNDNRDTP